MTIISAHLHHKGRKLGEFETVLAEIQDFMHDRSGQHLILGGDFNASFCGLTDSHHVGKSRPRPRTLTDTNDTLRVRALHAVLVKLDLTVTDTWIDASSKLELYTRSSGTEPRDARAQMDIIMVSRKLEAKNFK